MRHRRAPWRRRKLHHRRRIVADAIKGGIVQPRRQRLHPLPRRPRVISANNSGRRNPHKLRRLHALHRRHRRLRANNGSNGLSVHRNGRKLRRLRLLLRLQGRRQRRRQSRLPLRQRLLQNRPIPIRAKNRAATGKTTAPIRPDPVHRIGRAIFNGKIQTLL